MFIFIFMVECSDRGGSHFGDYGKVDVERFIRGLRGGQGSVIRGEELLEIVRGGWFSCCSDLELQRVFLISAR